uniref:Uncharacterized protein n=1 Tax=Romanomermis culicivorax TaxID=13658 RepID=A0A915HW73_ROMCU
MYTSSRCRADANQYGHSHHQSQSHHNKDQYDSCCNHTHGWDDHYEDGYDNCNNYHSHPPSPSSDQCHQCHY